MRATPTMTAPTMTAPMTATMDTSAMETTETMEADPSSMGGLLMGIDDFDRAAGE